MQLNDEERSECGAREHRLRLSQVDEISADGPVHLEKLEKQLFSLSLGKMLCHIDLRRRPIELQVHLYGVSSAHEWIVEEGVLNANAGNR